MRNPGTIGRDDCDPMMAVFYFDSQTGIAFDAAFSRAGIRRGASMPPNDHAKNTPLRLLACAFVGLAMAATTYVCAYFENRKADPYEDTHKQAFRSILDLTQILDDYHKENASYPKALADLNGRLPAGLELDPSGQILDPWNHPFEYQPDGKSYTLRSLGLDGKPGGPGLATDLDARDVVKQQGSYPLRLHIRPTFWQYTSDINKSRPVILSCILAGVFASVACFLTLRAPRHRLVGTIARLLGTLLACFVVTMFITALHAPSHH